MKHLLLSVAFLAPTATLAQYSIECQTHDTVLYRHLPDTLTGRYALRLRRGSQVELLEQQYGPHWRSVRRDYDAGTGFVQDTTRYFMRTRAIKETFPGL